MSGEIQFEDLMIAILTLMLGTLGLGIALNGLGDQKLGMQAARRIFGVIEEARASPIDGLSLEGLKPEHRSGGQIEFRNVNFRYPTRPDVVVCRNYNLTIQSGEVVALVGPSGSGKSTIMNLLLRFYDPESGNVFLDGVDIRELNVRWLRSQIGYVGQEPSLFTGSVADNVSRGRATYGDARVLALADAVKLDQSDFDTQKAAKVARTPADDLESGAEAVADEDVIAACVDSNAHEFIVGFPSQYDTDVGEGSIMVSGGQKQRIAIARALIKRPAVLLLDEATSALDAASEKLVQESIDRLQRSKTQTTIVIAHRLTTIMNADKIVVIDKGEVVEQGRHEELLHAQGLYAQLWNKQRAAHRHGPEGAN